MTSLYFVFIQTKAMVIFRHTIVDSIAPDSLCHSYDTCNMTEMMTRSFPLKTARIFSPLHLIPSFDIIINSTTRN